MSFLREINISELEVKVFHMRSILDELRTEQSKLISEDLRIEYEALKQQYYERLCGIVERNKKTYDKLIDSNKK